jgi:hypothetical protein
MSLLAAASALLPACRPLVSASLGKGSPSAARGAPGRPSAAPSALASAASSQLLCFPQPRLAAAYTGLLEEVRLLEAVLYKAHNQHRRAPYFAAFRSLHSQAKRVLLACKALGLAGGRSAGEAGAPRAAPGPGAAAVAAAAAGAAGAAARASAVALPLCRRILRPHTGAGFAGLGVVLAASAAVYWQCFSEIASALE